jgi:hypothetical protein
MHEHFFVSAVFGIQPSIFQNVFDQLQSEAATTGPAIGLR